jgi:SAM-dependent methyltransferase
MSMTFNPSANDLVRHSLSLGARGISRGRIQDGAWRVWMPLDIDRVVELPWTGECVRAARPRRVLDISSPKLLACWLAENTSSEVVATDLWASEIDRWRKLTRAADPKRTRYKRLTLDVADGRKLQYSDSSFDFAYSSSVIEHVADSGDSDMMGELERVLEPGGLLALTFPFRSDFENEFVKHDLYGEVYRGNPIFFQRHYSVEAVNERLLRGRSFEIVEQAIWRKNGVKDAKEGLASRFPPKWEVGRFLGPALLAIGSRSMRPGSLDNPGPDNVMRLLLRKLG